VEGAFQSAFEQLLTDVAVMPLSRWNEKSGGALFVKLPVRQRRGLLGQLVEGGLDGQRGTARP
jgi:hypothetical protein